jgi:hypothetical protein
VRAASMAPPGVQQSMQDARFRYHLEVVPGLPGVENTLTLTIVRADASPAAVEEVELRFLAPGERAGDGVALQRRAVAEPGERFVVKGVALPVPGRWAVQPLILLDAYTRHTATLYVDIPAQ